MKQQVNKYWVIFKTQLLHSSAYPVDLLSRSLTIVLFLWIFSRLWAATYQAAGAQVIAGLSERDTLWYLMVAEVITLSRPRVSGAIAEAVKSGAIAYLLNRPYNFLLYQAGVGLGDSALRLVCNALAGGTLTWLLVGPPPDLSDWPLALAAVAAAWAIDFCIAALIGLLAFFTEEIAAFEWIYSKLLLVLGGVLIPLDFFPEWLRAAAALLPFACTVYGPARCFVEPGSARFAGLFLSQALWLVVLGGALWACYRRSVLRLSINGG